LKRRPELEGIYAKICTANVGKFDETAFVKFMKEYQMVSFFHIFTFCYRFVEIFSLDQTY